VLVSDRIDDVRVTLKGSWRRLRKIDPRELDAVNLDLRHATGGEFPISNDMIHLPSGVVITSISPRSVHVAFDKRVDKLVEVTPAVTGRPEHGYVVDEIKPLPPTIKLRGGERMLAAVSSVRTHEISLEGHTDSFIVETEVQPPDGAQVISNPRISVQIRLDEELVTRKLPGLTVALKGDGDAARWTVTPAQVDVTLTGALLGVEKARRTLVPVVKLPPDARSREVEITVEGLPPGIGVKISPEHARLVPAKPASLPPPPRTP
jgi:YbbR domain-containing protein